MLIYVYIPRYTTSTIHRHCTHNNHASHTPAVVAERSSDMKMWFEIFLYRVRAVPGGYREDFPDREGDSRTGRLPVKPGGLTPMGIAECLTLSRGHLEVQSQGIASSKSCSVKPALTLTK